MGDSLQRAFFGVIALGVSCIAIEFILSMTETFVVLKYFLFLLVYRHQYLLKLLNQLHYLIPLVEFLFQIPIGYSQSILQLFNIFGTNDDGGDPAIKKQPSQ